jgi:hypothetical protein
MINTRSIPRDSVTIPGEPSALSQKLGGIAALLLGLVEALFLAVFLFVLPQLGFELSMFYDPPRFVQFVTQYYPIYFALSLVIVLFTPALVVLVRALDARMRALPASRSLVAIATPFGYIGATILILNALVQYASVRLFVSTPPAFAAGIQASATFDMTSMGASLVLGAWIFLLSWTAVRDGGLPRGLAYFGMLVALADLLALFGLPVGELLTTIWLLAVGVVLLSSKPVEMPIGDTQ